jgi:hypothetical protein
MNRNEQIIGRGVRNFSHKDLPFSKRNVQIFLYGTILQNTAEEAADLYVYRISEIKAVKIGKVTRLLKESAVDCVINHEQTELTAENFKKVPENQHVSQILSTNIEIEDFPIGDVPNSATCDYMDTCEFKCIPLAKDSSSDSLDLDSGLEGNLNYDTYNEAFMLVNSDKIIQKVKTLMKMRFFYKKHELIQLINIPKKYPMVQIYAALTQIINDQSEYISDKYNRTGYLVNIGDYYLFQPSELNFKNISIFDRSTPIDYKHDMIKFEIKNTAVKPVIDKRGLNEKKLGFKMNEFERGKEILKAMYDSFVITTNTGKVERGNKNWYDLCGVVVRKMIEEGLDKNMLVKCVIEHIVDTLVLDDKIELINFMWTNNQFYSIIPEEENFTFFSRYIHKYLHLKIIDYKKMSAFAFYDGPSSIDNLKIYILNGKQWEPAEPEDIRILGPEIENRYTLDKDDVKLNTFVGFIGFESAKKYMVYKVKDTTNERSTGYRCDQSGKEKVLEVLNSIGEDLAKSKDSAIELCVRQELRLRMRQKTNSSKGEIWFLDTEKAIFNEFEKKNKKE